MNKPISSTAHSVYQDFPDSVFATEFWDFYKVLWEAECRFDLVFRRDHGVAVWTANRLRFYYQIANELGLYDAQKSNPAKPAPAPGTEPHPPLPEIDFYIETGATGPACENRKRPHGCIYTSDTVRTLLERKARVLMLHDDPDFLVQDPNLHVITSAELRQRTREISLKIRQPKYLLNDDANAYWSDVQAFFTAELGIDLIGPETAHKLLTSHKKLTAAYRKFLEPLKPKAMICMTHYLRAPQIEAAKSHKIRVIDYQHGINSRYHLGYGYPNVVPEHRKIPYMPDEFWAWGRIWADPAWFPQKCCNVRTLGYPGATAENIDIPALSERPEKTVLVATSWAMQTQFRTIIERLAQDHPDWTIRAKLHPREQVVDYADLSKRHDNVEVLSGDVPILDAAAEVRYVLSICSSSLFDVLLRGCRIAVLHAPAAEYAEDFVTTFDVPILKQDGSNFAAVVDAMKQQDIPLDEVFHSPTAMDRQLLWESLSIPVDALRLGPPADATPETAIDRYLDERSQELYEQFEETPEVMFDPGLSLRKRLLAVHARKFRREWYDLNFRELVPELPLLAKKVSALTAAIGAGFEPARYVQFIRTLLIEAVTANDLRSAARIASAVVSTTDDNSAVIRAELFEHKLALSDGLSRRRRGTGKRYWKDAQQILRDLSPLTAGIADIYDRIAAQSHREYADTRVSRADADRLGDDILNRLKSRKPFTMIRLGDGESYAFDAGYVPAETRNADCALRENRWWGRSMTPETRRRLQHKTVAVIPAADMLAIPSPFRLLRDFSRTLLHLRGPIHTWPITARSHHLLFHELARMMEDGRLDWTGKTLLDDRCHQELFLPKAMRRFSVRDRPQVLVSCFTTEQVNAALGFRMFTHGIRTPPHSLVKELVPNDALANMSTPDMLDDLLDQVDRQAVDGAIFYVAAGLIGKILLGRIAARGATGLDIGAAADYWMGAKTRGYLDFAGF